MNSEPRAHTAEEAEKILIRHLMSYAKYWAELKDKTPEERCFGLLFSILVVFDGGSEGMPSFDISPLPHDDDKEWSKDQGINWFEKGMVINTNQMHETLCEIEREEYEKRFPKSQ